MCLGRAVRGLPRDHVLSPCRPAAASHVRLCPTTPSTTVMIWHDGGGELAHGQWHVRVRAVVVFFKLAWCGG